MRLLFVEDEPDLREVLEKSSCREAVIASMPAAMVWKLLIIYSLQPMMPSILDIMLPGVDGLSVLQKNA